VEDEYIQKVHISPHSHFTKQRSPNRTARFPYLKKQMSYC